MLSTNIGSAGGAVNTSGTNLAIDSDAQFADAGTIDNIAIGRNALNSTTDDATYNLAIGVDVLTANTTGDYNIGIGHKAMNLLIEGNKNIAIGAFALDYANDTAASGGAPFDNIAIGYQALTTLRGNDNTKNIAIGSEAMQASTGNTVTGNVCIGHKAGYNTSGDENVLIGLETAYNTDSDDNVCIGYRAEYNNTVGHRSIAIGTKASQAATGAGKGYYSVAIGFNAFHEANHTSHNGSIAIGYKAGYYVNPDTGSDSTAGNTLIGFKAGMDETNSQGVTTGRFNTAVGHQTLGANCGSSGNITGRSNTVIGYRSGWILKTSASYNTFMGAQSGVNVTTGDYNTAIGWKALAYDGSTALTGSSNVCVGFHSGRKLEGDGAENVFIGSYAGDACTTGDSNVSIGYASDVSAANNNQIAIGNGVVTDAADQLRIGDAANYLTFDFSSGGGTIAVTSDKRIKKDIVDTDLGIDFINKLRPVKFTPKNEFDYPDEFGLDKSGKRPEDPTERQDGLIAQEVKAVIDEMNVTFSGWSENLETRQQLEYSKFITPLIKAVQELSQQIEDLKKG